MTHPIAVLESTLNTVHPKGHPRAGKRIRVYVGLVVRPDKTPVYDAPLVRLAVGACGRIRWREEDPENAYEDARTHLSRDHARGQATHEGCPCDHCQGVCGP